MGRAVTLARMHEPEQATAGVEGLLRRADSAASLYNAACVFAVSAAAPALDPERAEQYAARAVQLLRKAVESGYQELEAMQRDSDSHFVHGRQDFNKLITDLEKKPLGKPQEH